MTFKKKLNFFECKLLPRIASTFALAPGQMLLPPSPSDLLLRKGPMAAFSQLKLPLTHIIQPLSHLQGGDTQSHLSRGWQNPPEPSSSLCQSSALTPTIRSQDSWVPESVLPPLPTLGVALMSGE